MILSFSHAAWAIIPAAGYMYMYKCSLLSAPGRHHEIPLECANASGAKEGLPG